METIEPRLIRRIIATLESIRQILDKPPNKIPTTETKEHDADRKSEPVQFLVSDTPEVRFHPKLIAEWRKDKHANSSHQRRLLNAQWATVIVGFFASVAAVVYAGIAAHQSKIMNDTLIEARKQTGASITAATASQNAATVSNGQLDLAKKQWAYSQAAQIGIHSIIQFSAPEQGFFNLYLDLLNDGHQTATNVIAKFQLSRINLIDRKIAIVGPSPIIIAPPFGITPANENVGRMAWLDTHRYSLNGQDGIRIQIAPEVIKAIRNAEQAIALDGKISYDDGFERQSKTVCLRYIAYAPEEHLSFHENDFVSCAGFPFLRSYILNAKKNYESHHPAK